MRLFALLSLLSLTASAQGRFERFCARTADGRGDRGLQCGGAYFEAFGTDARGTNGVCSSTPPTGAKGEVLTYAGAGAKTCTKGTNGLRSTAIADGDLVSLTALPRVEYDADGYLGLLVEAAASPITIQARPVCNAAWADVGTPACTADVTTGPWGTTTMARLTDDSGAAQEGRSQTMATTSATRFTAYCYVKGGTALEATIVLAGTGNAAGDCTAAVTGLSTTTSSIVSCTSAAAYTAAVTAVTASILVGDAVADQGDLYVEGCNVVPSATYRTSFVDAAAVTVARAAEAARFAQSVPTTAGFCSAATVTSPSTASFPSGSGLWAPGLSSGTSIANAPYVWPYTAGVGTQMSIDGTSSSAAPSSYAGAQNPDTSSRHIASNTGSLWRICKNSTCATNAAGAWASPTYTNIHLTPNAGNEGAHIWSRIVVDPNWARCGP